jgi:hypothetical protein
MWNFRIFREGFESLPHRIICKFLRFNDLRPEEVAVLETIRTKLRTAPKITLMYSEIQNPFEQLKSLQPGGENCFEEVAASSLHATVPDTKRVRIHRSRCIRGR